MPGGTAHWTFTDVTGNYNDAAGDAGHRHHQGERDGHASTATRASTTARRTARPARPTGVNGEALSGLNLGASFTNVPGGTANWTFTDATGNYNNASGTAAIVISKADATVTVNGYTGVYDGDGARRDRARRRASAAEPLSGLDLGASFTNVPGGTATLDLHRRDGNYNDSQRRRWRSSSPRRTRRSP